MGTDQQVEKEYSSNKNTSGIQTIHYKNGEYYQGEIKNNKRNGYGIYYYQNNDKYEGYWYENVRQGRGTFFFHETGEVYEGMFNNNKREGIGVHYKKNGDRYHGEWKDNKRHGKGEVYLENGSKFIGEFKFDKKNGLGKCIQKNGEVFYELWENGNLIKQSNQSEKRETNYDIDYFNECNANKFDKFLTKQTKMQNENKTNQMKSKYFPLEMAKIMKNKNIDKIENLSMIQNITSVVVGKPDVMQWNNEDVINWFTSIKCEKYIDKIIKSKMDGKKLLNCDNKMIENAFGISDKNGIANIMKNIAILKNLKIEKVSKNEKIIQENANSEEEDSDNESLQKHQLSTEAVANSGKKETKKNPNFCSFDEKDKVNILQELTKESKYFYSSINVNGLNYFINYEEVINEQIKLGKGGFGEVFLGEWQGKKVAIKKLTVKKKGYDLSKFINEINITSSLRHPNIVLYMGASVDKDNNYYMIVEYLPGGSLFDLIHTEKKELTDKEKIKIAMDIAIAVKYLHSRRIVHCDLKSSNILLDNDMNIKLGDFGLSRFLTTNNKETKHGRNGTPQWMAPEILKGGKYEYSSDVFSFGMILWELLTYQIPYLNIPQNEISNLITKEKKIVSVPKEGNPIIRDLSEQCIAYDPKDRPDFNKILKTLGGVLKKENVSDDKTKELLNYLL